jgi:hypothetical protein
MRRIINAFGAMLLAIVTGLAVTAGPAQAIGGRPYWVTGWDGALYSNPILFEFNPALLDLGECITLAPAYRNKASALLNSSNTTNVIAFKETGCVPGPGSTVWHNSGANMNAEWNNTIASFRRSWTN